jgi:hypothetical protein
VLKRNEPFCNQLHRSDSFLVSSLRGSMTFRDHSERKKEKVNSIIFSNIYDFYRLITLTFKFIQTIPDRFYDLISQNNKKILIIGQLKLTPYLSKKWWRLWLLLAQCLVRSTASKCIVFFCLSTLPPRPVTHSPVLAQLLHMYVRLRQLSSYTTKHSVSPIINFYKEIKQTSESKNWCSSSHATQKRLNRLWTF